MLSNGENLRSDSEADHSLCREEQESYWTNRVDDVLGTYELEARARYLVLEKEKTLPEDTQACGYFSRPFVRPIFPQEIFDIIISYLSDYPRALVKLILVSKHWVPLCRRYLYSSLDFGPEDNYEKKCPYPHHVQRMSLVSPYGYSDLDWTLPITRNMDKFTSLDHLELVDFPWDALWLDGGTGLFNTPVMRQVSKVFLGGVEVEALDDIAISISRGLPCLKELVVLMEVFEDGEEEPESPDSPAPLAIPQGLCELTLQDHPLYPTPTGFWWKWFILVKFTGLWSITLGDLLIEDYSLFKAFIDVAGRSLTHFGIGIASVQDLDTFTHHRMFSSCPNIQSLRITRPVRTMNDEWGCQESIDALCRLFSSFTAKHLRVVSLPAVRRWAVEVERGVRVEGVLSIEHFPVLEVVEFSCDLDVARCCRD